MSGEVAFGLAISEDRQRCAIVAAGRSQTGKILVDLAPFYDHPRGAVARMQDLYERHDPVAVALDAKSQAATNGVWAFQRWAELATPGVWAF